MRHSFVDWPQIVGIVIVLFAIEMGSYWGTRFVLAQDTKLSETEILKADNLELRFADKTRLLLEAKERFLTQQGFYGQPEIKALSEERAKLQDEYNKLKESVCAARSIKPMDCEPNFETGTVTTKATAGPEKREPKEKP